MNSNRICIIFVAFVFLQFLHYFDYIYYDHTVGRNICVILGLYMLFVYGTYKYNNKICLSKKYVAGFVFIPMLSFIPCYLEHGQNFVRSASVYAPLTILFLYFYIHKNKITVNSIIQILTIFAIIRTTIVIIEQFTYPYYLFAIKPEGHDLNGYFREIEVRSGIYRFYISDTYLSQFLIFYYFQKVTEKFDIKHFCLLIFGFVGLYLDQTRQFMATTIFALVIIAIIGSDYKYKRASLFFIVISVFIIYLNFDTLFGSLIEKTASESNEDNPRVLSYYTFLFQYWGGPLSYIFGNGLPGKSAYGDEIQTMGTDYGLYRADVGIVGFLNQYGIVSVLFFLYFYFHFIRKEWHYIDRHLKMFFVASFVNLPLVVFFVNNNNWYVFWAFMMYLLDDSIVRNKNKKRIA